MKRFIIFLTLVTLILGICTIGVFANTPSNTAITPKKILTYLKPDVTVKFNDAIQIFKDVNGNAVYPIIYNGSTYLPVRAISEIMQEPIEWDGSSKTVFIGKTLTNPSKLNVSVITGSAVAVSDSEYSSIKPPDPSMVSAYLKPDVLIMYDFVMQSFQDVNGDTVYPIIYNGSTYLPIRAISKLMKEPIEWDGTTKTVEIGDGEDIIVVIVEEDEKENLATTQLRDIFNREEALYYEATAKISNIKSAPTLEEKQVIATTISENYLSAQSIHTETNDMNQSDFTDEEHVAYEKLAAFVESVEYYILVLENIAYLAAADTDYSMLADTFLYFALDSQAKMDEARSVMP